MTKVKFCGNRTPEDVSFVNEARPDYAGFILTKGFRRTVDDMTAEKLAEAVRPGISRVGVFVDDAPERVARFLNEGIVDIVQLHGNETEEYIGRLRGMTSGTVMKCFRPETAEDVRLAMGSSADLVMLDGGSGSGRAFDWSLLREADRDYFLAGGLTPENVGDAVRRLRPFAVDTSSGTETEGKKDIRRMRRFMDAVRDADRDVPTRDGCPECAEDD